MSTTPDKYPTKAADQLRLGDTVMIPLVVTELRLTAGRVDVTYSDGSSTSHVAGDVIPMAEGDRLPDVTPEPTAE